MKDNIILVLWFLYSLGSGILTVVYAGQEDRLEAFGLGVLAALLLLGIYIILTLIVNNTVEKIKFRVKLNPPKRFKNKVTPIYKLTVWEGTKNCFSIGKYELQWVDFDAESYRFYLVPFITLFQRYKYVPVDYYEFEMDLDAVEDISLLWEGEYALRNKEKIELITAEQKEISRVDKLNKVFLENYE